MCGIAGFLGPTPPSQERIAACLGLMRRRGPDAAAWLSRPAGPGRQATLLHTRLSIIDLGPASDQPFVRGDSVLAYNGEVYNYIEARSRLERMGPSFTTAGDTEVLAAALDLEGPAGLEHLEGMWAFAFLDGRDGTLLLGRDRFAEKPLYLLELHGGLYFGSEIKFLAALSGHRPEPDLEHLRRYLVNGYKAIYKTASTFFRGVAELPPGCVLRLPPGGERKLLPYHAPWTEGPERDMDFASAVAGARERLIRSVELRLRSDVPLAFCMSGGVDSVGLISIARRVLDFDVHGFTIVNTDARYDEWDLVEGAVRDLGIRHTAAPLATDDFLPRLRELVRQHDAPVYTITYFAHWLLMRAMAEQGYKVSVSGTAADELFTGYYDHQGMYLAEMAPDPAAYARALADWRAHVAPVVRNPLLQDPEAFVKNPGQREHLYLENETFSGLMARPFAEPFREAAFRPGLLKNRMDNELFYENIPVILHEDDLNAMHCSIENRSPYLDRELYAFCRSIPVRHLMGDGFNKRVLREALRGIAPDAVLDNRRKVGFNAPLRGFLDASDPEVAAWLAAENPLDEVVDRGKVLDMLASPEQLPNSRSKFLFSVICARLFLEECQSLGA